MCCFDAMQAVYALYGVDVDFPIIDNIMSILLDCHPQDVSVLLLD